MVFLTFLSYDKHSRCAAEESISFKDSNFQLSSLNLSPLRGEKRISSLTSSASTLTHIFVGFVCRFRVIYVSFGGLQMMLTGDPFQCTKFKNDQRMFLLIRKVPYDFVTE